MLQNRKQLSPLQDELPELAPQPILTEAREQFLQKYFTLLVILLAAIVSALTVLLHLGGVGVALQRAAVLLALGSVSLFFVGFPFGDLAAAIGAGEHGVLFRGDALPRLLGTQLCCLYANWPSYFSDIAVFPAMPEKLNSEHLVRIAALVLSGSEHPMLEKLLTYTDPASEGSIERIPLEGYGILARMNDLSILCGSAELMKKAELPVIPFQDGDTVLHIAVNGAYAGCIDLGEAALPEDASETALQAAGFYCFASEEEASAKRDPGEQILFLSPNGRPYACQSDDLYAAAGIRETDADVVLAQSGKAGICALSEQIKNARLCRKALLLLSAAVKALLLVAAIFGVCPLAVAVAIEMAVSVFSVIYAMRALEADAKY